MRVIHCTSCRRDLPVECFPPGKVTDGTKNLKCRKCKSAYARAWNLAHPERCKENKLRCRANLQILTATENMKKRNHLPMEATLGECVLQ